MHAPRSILLSSLLALATLTPSIVANPVPVARSICLPPGGLFTTLQGPFTLDALSDTLPPQTWIVGLNNPSPLDAEPPYLTHQVTQLARPVFALNAGELDFLTKVGGSWPARLEPDFSYPPLKQWLFGTSGKSASWNASFKCDATGTPFLRLQTAQRRFLFDLFDLEILMIKSISRGRPFSSQFFPSLPLFSSIFNCTILNEKRAIVEDREGEEDRSLIARPSGFVVRNFTEHATIFGTDALVKNSGNYSPLFHTRSPLVNL